MQNTTIVTEIAGPFSNSATQVRITLSPNASEWGNTIIENCWLGHPASSGAPAFNGDQKRVTFNGANGCTLIQGSTPIVSDPVTFAVATTDTILIATDLGNTPAMAAGPNSVITSYYKLSGSDAATTNKTGYTNNGLGESYLISEVDFYS
jgi:hypothetical protein